MVERKQNTVLLARLAEPRKTIQVVAGPRQVGKTTMVKQVLKQCTTPAFVYNADAVSADDSSWIAERWAEVRSQMAFNNYGEAILVFDEIHKIDNWSEQVKREWDNDTFRDINIKVVLLGSSRLLLKRELTESLAGRFEIISMGHWSFAEMQEAFGWNINQYVYFGGYPGSAAYIENEARWRRYMREAIVSPAIEKDVLQTSFIYKPVLLNQLFHIGCAYSGELLSYNKMLGMLQDAGNAGTLVSYLQLLSDSKLLVGLQKYAVDQARKYKSVPKLQVYNNALLSAMSDGMTYKKAFTTPALWGRWVESAIGCYLLDKAEELECEIYYWRENNDEVDFVLTRADKILAIEVKSGRRQQNKGMAVFKEKFHPQFSLVVGGDAMPLETFFAGDISRLL